MQRSSMTKLMKLSALPVLALGLSAGHAQALADQLVVVEQDRARSTSFI